MDGFFPLVSIGMSVRNCQNTLVPTIQSLLFQTYPYWELLLIDDGSSDETLGIARSFVDTRIKIFTDGTPRGLVDRLNQALALSSGKYFARMDGDDVAYPERLEHQVSYLEQHPDVDLVGAWAIVFGKKGSLLGKRTGPETHAGICARPSGGFPMMHPTYVGRLGWFRHYRYREEAVRCEDQDLLLRSYRTSQFVNLPEILLGYREEQIALRKILSGRHHFAKILFAEFKRQGRLDLAMRVVAEQALKGTIDGLAVASGLNYRVLRHRAQPTTSNEEQIWEQIWRRVNQSVDNHAA